VGLDDDRRADLAGIGLGLRRIVEAAIGGRRNAVAGAQVLGEALGTLELGGLLRRAEDADAGGLELVGKAGHQRRFRADDDEVDVLFLRERNDGRVIVNRERNAFRFLRNAGIAR